MSLPPSFLDELRARTRVSSVIGQDVKLIKAGKEFKACCPFHNEKTPSFYVNDEKGFYHCFGCSKHGDAISFLTDYRGLGFMDAVKELAGKVGMEVPAPDPQAQERAQKRAGLIDVTEASAAWFREQLNGIEGSAARTYIENRGLTQQTIEKFGLGFAPDSRGKLKRALSQFDEQMLVDAGMLIDVEGKEPYDRFRGRMMVPIRDARGRTIAFGGRIIGDGEPKYLNSPDTPLFDKGNMLFNLDLASAAARKAGRVIVVEGYMDVIALDQAGIGEAVAPNGTALTEGQLHLLWRMSDNPVLCFDGDAAGQKAAWRALERALPHLNPDRTLQFAKLPAGQDPDDLIKAGGAPLIGKFLANTRRFDEKIWDHYRAEIDPSSPADRARLLTKIRETSFSIADQTLANQTWAELKSKFFEEFGFKRSKLEPVADLIDDTKSIDLEDAYVRAVLFGLMRFPELISDMLEPIQGIRIKNDNYRNWRSFLVDSVLSNPNLHADGLEQMVNEGLRDPPGKRDKSKDLAYSFFYKIMPDLEEKAREDLRRVISILYAEATLNPEAQDFDKVFEQDISEANWETVQGARREAQNRASELQRFLESLAA